MSHRIALPLSRVRFDHGFLADRARRVCETVGETLYFATAPMPVRAVPYALWVNRGEGEMRVWLRES